MTLRSVIEEAAGGEPLLTMTVLAVGNDPYRQDTPGGHEIGKWFAEQVAGIDRERVHIRGLHYTLLNGAIRHDGMPYTNTFDNWNWLNLAAKSARWLGYIPFDRIVDERNAAPVIRLAPTDDGRPSGRVDSYPLLSIDSTVNLDPVVALSGFNREQSYRLALYGEKSSLEPILSQMADEYGADLFLPTGECSDTMLYQMAKAGAGDGRKYIIFSCCDFDPSGHGMPVSIGRKLQAFRDLEFSNLRFEVHPVAVTLDQAIDFDLPQTPLKESETRASSWRRRMGRDQTEIDAFVTLHESAFRDLIREAVAPFYDDGLSDRIAKAERKWLEEATEALSDSFDESALDELTGEAEELIADTEAKLDEIRESAEALLADISEIELPPVPEIPESEADGVADDLPLIDSDWSWTDQTKALIERKFGGDDPGEGNRIASKKRHDKHRAAKRAAREAAP